MSAELEWGEIERYNGSILCERFLQHERCTRTPCQWKHSLPKPGEPLPLCYKNFYNKGGCGRGELCALSHDRPGVKTTAETDQNQVDNLSLSLTKEPQTDDLPHFETDPEPTPRMNQLPMTSTQLVIGNGNKVRANIQTNQGPTFDVVTLREDRKQQRDASLYQVTKKFEDPGVTKTRSIPEINGGVPLEASLPNGRGGLPQAGIPVNTHHPQRGSFVSPAHTAENKSQVVSTSDQTGRVSHGFVPPYGEHRAPQNYQPRLGNGLQTHPPYQTRPMRDETTMGYGPNFDSRAAPNIRPNGALQRTGGSSLGVARFNNGFNSQIQRVMGYDSRPPTMTERQPEAQFGMNHRPNGFNRFPEHPHPFNLGSPPVFNRENRHSQANFHHASSVPLGDPGGYNGNNRIWGPRFENGPIGPSQTRRSFGSELRGGGVTPNGFPHTPQKRNGPEVFNTPITTPLRYPRKEAGVSDCNFAKNQEHSSRSSSVSATPKLQNGTSSGKVVGGADVTMMFQMAIRRNGRLGPRSEPRSPESPRDNPRYEVEDTEGGAKICDTEHSEHEEGGAKLPVEQNTQPGLPYPKINANLTGSNKSVVNDVASSPQGGLAPISAPIGPKIWVENFRKSFNRQNQPVQSNGGNHFAQGPNWGTNNTQNMPEFSHQQAWSGIKEPHSQNGNITEHHQSMEFGGEKTAVPRDMAPANLQSDTSNGPLSPGPLQNQVKAPSRESQSQLEPTSVNRDSDFAHIRSNRDVQLRALYTKASDNLPTMFSYDSESSFGSQCDNEPNLYKSEPAVEPERSYTPEPEVEPDSANTSEPESDPAAEREFYEQQRIAASANRGSWEDLTPPKSREGVEFEEFIKGDLKDDDAQERKDLALTVGLKNVERLARKKLPALEQSSEKKSLAVREETSKKTTTPIAEQPLEKKAPIAWKTPLPKKITPPPPPPSNQDLCWVCGTRHQRDDCKADPEVIEDSNFKSGWVKKRDSSGDWNFQGNGHTGSWFEKETVEITLPEPKKQGPAKLKKNQRERRVTGGSQKCDNSSAAQANRSPEGEVTEPAKPASKGFCRKKVKKSSPNGKSERTEPASENSAEATKADGPKSILFKADGNHFGQYYETKLNGIKKLSEDTLHMIFSYVADGLMPEDQMKMKNVHIGSNFRLDASFTTTRYRRLKSVILSCRYWRNLSQHIVYKYVNLDQFHNFKRFAHTISENPELGRMVRAVKINIQGGASYTTHDNRVSRQELIEMPKSSDSAQLFTLMMESCPELQILSVNMYGAISGFNFVLTKFPKMREMQIMDDSSKGMVAHNLWKNLENCPSLEKFKIFHSEENGAMNFDSLKILPRTLPKSLFDKGSSNIVLKALTMERAPELSNRVLEILASRLKQLTQLVIVDCKLVTSSGLARAIQKMPNPSQLNRLIYYVWVDPFGKATKEEMAPQKDHLCSTIRQHCTNLTYLNWKPYRICGDFWKESNFHLLKRCRIEPMVFKDCNNDIELRNHSRFMDAYKQAREEERLPELAEDRAVFDFYF